MKASPSFSRRAALTALVLVSSAGAADWSHIMGPDVNRKTSETAAPWSAGKPKRLWEIPAEGGFSSFVTGDGKAFTVVGKNGRETAMAVDRTTGKTLWEVAFGEARYRNGGERGVPGNNGGDGPRATPVYADKRVYIFGGKFDLHVLDSATGKILWQHDLIKEFGGSEIVWSNAASPLVLGDRVLVSGGGSKQSFIAFKADTGEVLWKSGNDRPTHATPVIATIHGKKQALFRVERGLVSLDPENGHELWHYPFPAATATAPSAVVWNDIVACVSGYGVGGGACQVTLKNGVWEVVELWRSPGNRDTAAHWSTSVAHEGYLYGCYGHNAYGVGAFKCIDIRTGKVMWQQPGFGHGQVIMAGKHLLATTDTGALTLIDPTPSAYRQLAQADIIEGKVWSSPAFSNGQIFLRSTTHGVCVEL
ncbi:MAG: PQQ-binding-like beta-propeller repeat protein [Opitutaceae bacterium]